jgi:hypothetical protein
VSLAVSDSPKVGDYDLARDVDFLEVGGSGFLMVADYDWVRFADCFEVEDCDFLTDVGLVTPPDFLKHLELSGHSIMNPWFRICLKFFLNVYVIYLTRTLGPSIIFNVVNCLY